MLLEKILNFLEVIFSGMGGPGSTIVDIYVVAIKEELGVIGPFWWRDCPSGLDYERWIKACQEIEYLSKPDPKFGT